MARQAPLAVGFSVAVGILEGLPFPPPVGPSEPQFFLVEPWGCRVDFVDFHGALSRGSFCANLLVNGTHGTHR